MSDTTDPTLPVIHFGEILPATRKLNFAALTSVIFFTVCGGAFGIEPLFGKVGAGWAIVLIVATPVLWSVPISLMVSELSSAMPVEGGYYIWVKRALAIFGDFRKGGGLAYIRRWIWRSTPFCLLITSRFLFPG